MAVHRPARSLRPACTDQVQVSNRQYSLPNPSRATWRPQFRLFATLIGMGGASFVLASTVPPSNPLWSQSLPPTADRQLDDINEFDLRLVGYWDYLECKLSGGDDCDVLLDKSGVNRTLIEAFLAFTPNRLDAQWAQAHDSMSDLPSPG